MIINNILYAHIMPAHTILTLLFGRILFAAIGLSFLTMLIISIRKNTAPSIRSRLWVLCVPALIVPFEHGVIALVQGFGLHAAEPYGIAFELWQPILSYIWLAGFIISAFKTGADNRRNLHLIKACKLKGCAAYFHRWRSHIYLPPDYSTAYSPAEQSMLLAHERQHIIQHDPLLFRFLQIVQCVFWFSPMLHKAIRLIRQDRELLCDERAAQGYCKREYGLLLLREAQSSMPCHRMAGIAAEPGGVYERIAACAVTFPRNRKNVALVLGIAVIILAVGILGFLMPAFESPMDIKLYLIEGASLTYIEGADGYFSLAPEGIIPDQKSLYKFATSAGLEPEQRLYVYVISGKRPTLTSHSTISNGFEFAVHELEGEMAPFSAGTGQNAWKGLFRFI